MTRAETTRVTVHLERKAEPDHIEGGPIDTVKTGGELELRVLWQRL